MNDVQGSPSAATRRSWTGKAVFFSCAAVILTYCTFSQSANAVDGKVVPQDPMKKGEKLKLKLEKPAEKSATDKSKSHDKDASEKPAHDKKKAADKPKKPKEGFDVGPLKVIWVKVAPATGGETKRVFFEVTPSQDTDGDSEADRSHFCFVFADHTAALNALFNALADQEHVGVVFTPDPDGGKFPQKFEANDFGSGPFSVFISLDHMSATTISNARFTKTISKK